MAAPTTTTPIPSPDARTLLPPLLACLPTAFVSPHPPPALLPLLSPILRQRVSLLAGNTSAESGNWLSLLSWDTTRAKNLATHLEGVHFEAHPVSGELELEDVQETTYRRLDEETLHARLAVSEFELLPVFVWVENDDAPGGAGPGWKLAELRVLGDAEDGSTWSDSISSADATAAKPAPTPAPAPAVAAPAAAPVTQPAAPTVEDENDNDGDDDAYWALYDSTPLRTPAKHSPAPPPTSRPFQASNLSATTTAQVGPTAEELEYFARYASEVQPALDSHDPDEEEADGAVLGEGGSTLRGGELTRAAAAAGTAEPDAKRRRSGENGDDDRVLEAPRASSPSSQASVERLERAAEEQQLHRERRDNTEVTRAEVGVRQFIGTEVKSLFRLARSVGMDRTEFIEVVERELEVLGFMEKDD